MSGAKVGYVAPIAKVSVVPIAKGTLVASSILAPTIVAGAIVVGGIYVAKYGYIKVKYEKLKLDFNKYKKEIEEKKEKLIKRYQIKIENDSELSELISTILHRYELSLSKILVTEEESREKVKSLFSQKIERLRGLEMLLIEMDRELITYFEIIEKLERRVEQDSSFLFIQKLYQQSKKSTNIQERRGLINTLKDKIESYEEESLKYFILNKTSNIEEYKIIEEHQEKKLKREITLIMDKLKVLEPNYVFNFHIDSESTRLELIQDEVKVAYAKVKKYKVLKDELLNLSNGIDDPDLNGEVRNFIKQIEFNRENYDKLIDRLQTFHKQKEEKEENALIIQNVVGGLEALGYEIVDEALEELKLHKEIYIDIEESYKLRVIFQKDNSYRIRFIKEIAKGYSQTENEKQRDREILEKWSNDYEKLLLLLKNNGLEIKHKMKLDPDIEDIEYIEVNNVFEQNSTEKVKINKTKY